MQLLFAACISPKMALGHYATTASLYRGKGNSVLSEFT